MFKKNTQILLKNVLIKFFSYFYNQQKTQTLIFVSFSLFFP